MTEIEFVLLFFGWIFALLFAFNSWSVIIENSLNEDEHDKKNQKYIISIK